MLCRMFSRIPGVYPLDVSAAHSYDNQINVSRHCSVYPRVHDGSQLRNTSLEWYTVYNTQLNLPENWRTLIFAWIHIHIHSICFSIPIFCGTLIRFVQILILFRKVISTVGLGFPCYSRGSGILHYFFKHYLKKKQQPCAIAKVYIFWQISDELLHWTHCDHNSIPYWCVLC